MTTPSNEPLKLFYCYAHEDKLLRDELDSHLSLMQRQKLLTVWYDREIRAGIKWVNEIDTHLKDADIILLLVSARFLASNYCYGIEMQQALQRDKEGTARVIPIILRPVDWEGAPFSHLQILPEEAKPVTRWPDRDDAFEDIAREIRKVVKELRINLKAKECLNEGNRLYNLKQFEEALVAYEEAIRLDAKYANAYTRKGNVLNDLNRNEEALVAHEEAIRLNPKYALAYYNKGVVLSELKRYEEALVVLEEVVRLDPKCRLVYMDKGNVLYILKRNKEGPVVYEKAIRLDPNLGKGGALRELNWISKAIVALTDATRLVSKDADDADVHYK